MAAFEELGLLRELGVAVSAMNWDIPTAIQCDAIPAILGGGDVLIAAESGSGKTGAFSLPIVQIAYETRKGGSGGAATSKQADGETVALSMRDHDVGLEIDDDGFRCENRNVIKWNGARANASVRGRGKYYYEVSIVKNGLCRVGWSREWATLNIGNDSESWGFGGTGMKSHAKKFERYGESFTMGDTIGCLLDLEEMSIRWSKNGRVFPPAYTLQASALAESFYPAVTLKTSALHCNFGATPFKFAPKGATAVSECGALSFRSASARTDLALSHKMPLSIVLEPTYDLVRQTMHILGLFGAVLKEAPVRAIAVTGKVDTQQIIDQIDEGIEVVVGTTSRVFDLVESGVIPVKSLRSLVLDEADQLIWQQRPVVERLMEKLPRVTLDGTRPQVILCSATLHNNDVKQFADSFMHYPAWIDLIGMESIPDTVHHVVCPVDAGNDKQWIRLVHSDNRLEHDNVHHREDVRPGTTTAETLSFGTKILKGIYVLKAIEKLSMKRAMVFCRTKQQCDQMVDYLKLNGHNASSLHGDRDLAMRRSALSDFKAGRLPFLVCTDVAARGIDVDAIHFVINVTLPDTVSQYVHRVGRVGRADRMGLSISLVSEFKEKVWYHKCRKGENCANTRDVRDGGCTIWYNEKQLLGEVEQQLGLTIATVDADMNIPIDEFDGKVVYGARKERKASSRSYAERLKASVAQLADLERNLQMSYLKTTQ